ncbi:hypothetical protein U0070_017453, partial [Myodes glareolus]
MLDVERRPGAKPFFPAVYKEFEELHDVVKRMCQDDLSSSDLCPQEPLEINNDEVARSLGITEYLRKKDTHPSSAPECSSQEMKGQLQDTSGQKRGREQAVVASGEGLATVKKARTAALPTDVPECPAAISGCQQTPGSSHAPASKGSASAATENPSPCSEGSCGEMVPASDGSVPPVGQQLSVAEPRGLPPAQLSMFPEENAPEHTAKQDSEAIQRSNGVCGTPSSGEGAESLLLEESGNAEAGDLREMSQPHLSRQQGSPSHALPTKAAAFRLQKTLPMNVLSAARVSKTMPVPGPQPGPDGSLPTNGGPSVGSEAGNVSWVLSRMEADGRRELETVAAVGEALAFEISDLCQEVLSQGQEQEHALQLQLAVALYVRLVEPHGQVGQDEVAVSSMGQLSTNGVLQEEFLLVCTGEP